MYLCNYHLLAKIVRALMLSLAYFLGLLHVDIAAAEGVLLLPCGGGCRAAGVRGAVGGPVLLDLHHGGLILGEGHLPLLRIPEPTGQNMKPFASVFVSQVQ